MGAGSLHDRDVARYAPHEKPVAGITHVAFVAAAPVPAQGVHSMATPKFFEGLRCVLDDEVNGFCERGIIYMPFIEALEVALERWREPCLQAPHYARAASSNARPES